MQISEFINLSKSDVELAHLLVATLPRFDKLLTFTELQATHLQEDSKPTSPGESSKKRNSSSVEATVSISLHSPGRSVGVHGSDDCKESTTNTSGSHGSNPNNEGQ